MVDGKSRSGYELIIEDFRAVLKRGSLLLWSVPSGAASPSQDTGGPPRQRGVRDMAAKGRPSGFKMPDEHRTKIANSRILNRLIKFAAGEEENGVKVEMSPHQVTAGLGLLRKVLPDLSNVELSGPGENGEFVMRFKFE